MSLQQFPDNWPEEYKAEEFVLEPRQAVAYGSDAAGKQARIIQITEQFERLVYMFQNLSPGPNKFYWRTIATNETDNGVTLTLEMLIEATWWDAIQSVPAQLVALEQDATAQDATAQVEDPQAA